MDEDLLILEPGQKRFFDDNGYLLLPGFYGPGEMEEMRRQYHQLVTDTDRRPQNMKYSLMEPVEGYPPDRFNPKNVVGMMDQTLANDYWFDQFTEPRIVSVMVDLLGPNLDFHNGKIRNKPPGFTNTQGWHQDWPYELHTQPDLAAGDHLSRRHRCRRRGHRGDPGSHLDGFLPTVEDRPTLVQENVPEERREVVPGATRGRGGHPRPCDSPGREQLHLDQPQRHHQRVQDRGDGRPVEQPLRLRRTAAGAQPQAADAARQRGGEGQPKGKADMTESWERSDNEVLATLQDVVAIESVNPSLPGAGTGKRGMVEYLSGFFDGIGLPFELSEALPGRRNIIARLEGEDPDRALLFECHMDTASVEVMSIPPFEPHIRDGLMYGRGSADTKAGGSP